MNELRAATAAVAAEHRFSGVVRVDRAGHTELAAAFGLAERAFAVPNTLGTLFGLASACKGFTALTVVSLVDEGLLALSTTARSLLADDLPEIDDRVTVEHLLAHRSGIGDYLDEDAGFDASDYVMPVSVHELATTEGYLPALEGHPSRFTPGEKFAYNNAGFVVLALMVERVTGTRFYDLVAERVFGPAGMVDTAFLRADELPARAARGYLSPEGLRTNVMHLPVRGSGDGGVYSTVADIRRFWRALFDGRIVPEHWLEEMVRPRSDVPAEARRYGLGFWLHQSGEAVMVEGHDAGVSCRSVHHPSASTTWTVVSNTSEGAWPVAGFLDEALLG
jgi:CubicO group peptidase (beta-lactamase class C family)